MEYTFKNSRNENARSAVLSESGLMLQCPEREQFIPYRDITSVQLLKRSKRKFALRIKAKNHSPILVSNKYYLPNGACEDRSRYYSIFVHVLHFHLKEKCRVDYKTGFDAREWLVWITRVVIVSLAVSFFIDYAGFRITHAVVQGVVLTVIGVAAMLVLNRNQLPKTYLPEDIPPGFLPSYL